MTVMSFGCPSRLSLRIVLLRHSPAPVSGPSGQVEDYFPLWQGWEVQLNGLSEPVRGMEALAMDGGFLLGMVSQRGCSASFSTCACLPCCYSAMKGTAKSPCQTLTLCYHPPLYF